MIFVDSLPVGWSKTVSLGSVNAGRTIWVALEVSSEFIHPRNSMQGPVLSVESNAMAHDLFTVFNEFPELVIFGNRCYLPLGE
jgi:hypothetical protein